MQFSLMEMGLIALLATYRITLMVNSEDGPGHIFERFRFWIGVRPDQYSKPYGTNWFAEGVLCFYCLSVWISTLIVAALVLGALLSILEGVLIALCPFALSGGAVFLRKWGG